MNVVQEINSERRALDVVVADGIRAKILEGALGAGTHLVESDFAKEFDVSNGTIRSGLRHLQNEGLVEFRPRRGMFVASLSSEDVLQLCSLRDALESLAAEEAAANATDEEKRQLQQILKEMKGAVKKRQRMACMELDLAFHKHIMVMSKHRRLEQMYGLLESQIRLFIALTEPTHSDLFSDMIPLHEPIADAILTGDRQRARQLSSQHNRADGEALAKDLLVQIE